MRRVGRGKALVVLKSFVSVMISKSRPSLSTWHGIAQSRLSKHKGPSREDRDAQPSESTDSGSALLRACERADQIRIDPHHISNDVWFCKPSLQHSDALWTVILRKTRIERSLVPAERIELPTFGLQNRCTTAVLRRPNGTTCRCRAVIKGQTPRRTTQVAVRPKALDATGIAVASPRLACKSPAATIR